ncbi:GspH/FimT family pseudopilin [Dokdonella sp. MW10]|uniref:GspH/FimT family pseudopilin n=1 Tax=Dokdonella sp. MW10 TaxID=2992926 RepID=UPI003F7D0737
MASRQRASGFGLIELLVVISIIAILGAIALPSFSSSLRGNRVTTQANDFLAALNFARNEAITRTRPVTICAADTRTGVPAGCGAAADWSRGWLIFVDTAASGAGPAYSNANLIRSGIANERNTMTMSPAQNFIRFDTRGQAFSSPSVPPLAFTLKPASNCSNDQQRTITISAMGRSGSSKVPCA